MGGVQHVLKVTVSQLTVEHALGTVVLGLWSWDCGLGTVVLSSACASGGITVEQALGPAVLSGVSSVQHVPALVSSSPSGSWWWGYSAESSQDVKRESKAGTEQLFEHHWRELPQVSFLLRQTQKTCFVATKVCLPRQSFCRNKVLFVATKYFCRNKGFVATSILLTRQKACFVVTDTC